MEYLAFGGHEGNQGDKDRSNWTTAETQKSERCTMDAAKWLTAPRRLPMLWVVVRDGQADLFVDLEPAVRLLIISKGPSGGMNEGGREGERERERERERETESAMLEENECKK